MSGNQVRGLVEAVMRRLETAMLDGTLPANTRIPSERLLAEHYEVSRNTVREAIQRLSARGLLRSRPGAGVYVTEQLRTGIASPWRQLVADHPALREDLLEFRRVLEGAAAYFAAQRSTPQDCERIMGLLGELESARGADDMVAEADADARLHDAIALASHNTMFLHLHNSIVNMLREHITLNGTGLRELDEAVSQQLLLQHRAVCEAICEHRPEEARTAMQSHMDFVRRKMPQEGEERKIGPTRRRSRSQ